MDASIYDDVAVQDGAPDQSTATATEQMAMAAAVVRQARHALRPLPTALPISTACLCGTGGVDVCSSCWWWCVREWLVGWWGEVDARLHATYHVLRVICCVLVCAHAFARTSLNMTRSRTHQAGCLIARAALSPRLIDGVCRYTAALPRACFSRLIRTATSPQV